LVRIIEFNRKIIGQLGIPNKRNNISKFTEIEALAGKEVK